ncbi:tubby C-terminal-like domain-containing protein [Catenaria anguillulae PL171]|uniref:Tubby C-terminal-like domain-containing protein n=1 Tax=Catenaria anguillulae PL171 TaxID=765915 RepID=A0A1Y2HQV4_9FUNG|nr:tubby C-terminal-like domain-containing protein [Catenaria anguillulae PL171]
MTKAPTPTDQPLRTLEKPIAIIGSEWCMDHPTTYVLKEKTMSWSSNDFKVYGSDGNPVFWFDGNAFSGLSEKTTMYFGERNKSGGSSLPPAVLNVKREAWEFAMFQSRAYVYKGGSSSSSPAMRITCKSLMGEKTVKVSLPDRPGIVFRMRKQWLCRDMDVYMEGDSQPVARVHRKYDARRFFLDADTYAIDVTAGLDVAAIVAVIVAVDVFFEKGS